MDVFAAGADQQLQRDGWPWVEKACSAGAQSGHLEVLQWGGAPGNRWRERMCDADGRRGHLDVRRRAHADGCLGDEWTCAQTAENGHLEVGPGKGPAGLEP